MSEHKRCEKCGAIVGHNVKCPDMPMEEKAKLAEIYHAAWCKSNENRYNRIKKMKAENEFLRSKLHVLKHENNKLRKALYQKMKTPQSSSEAGSSLAPK